MTKRARRLGWLIGIELVLVTVLGAMRASAADKSVEAKILRPVGPPSQVLRLKAPLNHEVTPEMRQEHIDILDQLPELRVNRTLSFNQFMREVEENNCSLATQRLNVPIAQAQLAVAHIYPDPFIQGVLPGMSRDTIRSILTQLSSTRRS